METDMSGINESAYKLLFSTTKIVVATSTRLDDLQDVDVDINEAGAHSRDSPCTSPARLPKITRAPGRDARSLSPVETVSRLDRHPMVKCKSMETVHDSFGIMKSMTLQQNRLLAPSGASRNSIHLSVSETNLAERLSDPRTATWQRSRFAIRRSPDTSPKYPLHYPKNMQSLIAALSEPDVNPDSMVGLDLAPVHALVTNKRKDREELLEAFFIHSQADINLCTADGNTGLHFAAMEGDKYLVRIFVGFGAKLNLLNGKQMTALDIALAEKNDLIVNLLFSCGATTGDLVQEKKQRPKKRLCRQQPTECPLSPVDRFRRRTPSQRCASVSLRQMEDGATLVSLPDRLKQCINFRLEESGSFSANTDEAIAITMQQKEIRKFNKTAQYQSLRDSCKFSAKGGSRILFLDGGGIRGLIQIEVLQKLEEETGRKIVELFDWIVGTSTGGIIALGLVYANKSLCELRQMYFKIKDKVFANDRLGFAYNTEALEDLLKEELGTTATMDNVQYPRVLIGAVNKKTTIPELHFFNNCFYDEFSTQPVWKVARYTSAAPMFFKEFENYVDGGVLANNPSESGFSAIQNYFRQQGARLSVALVVSLGCGVYPAEELGKVDAQQFLFFGKHWLKAGYEIRKRTKNLLSLLTTALVDSENIAKNSKSRMAELQIPFYRFSPQLDEVIPSGETDTPKLLDMIVKARMDTATKHMEELIHTLNLITEIDPIQ